ncbi:MAG TPA: hypothetical protein VKT77_18165, partial [Chthonomonadaceae bacterium]|nr:hypothetical protein [Chthonomonadaceae bacterium]
MNTNPEGIAIGPARPGDLAEILALYRLLNPDDPELAADGPVADRWRSILASPALYYPVARDGGRVVATC